MSGTDKTAPFWVSMARGDHVSRPEHHCNGAVCDLAESPAVQYGRRAERLTCYWAFVYTGKNICGCAQCTGQLDRRKDRRRDRHEAKAELRKEAP